MDPLSLISSCISIVHGIELIYDFARKNIHSSNSVKGQLGALIARCSACKGIIEGIKIQAELDKGNSNRLYLLDHVKEPLTALEGAIQLITEKLKKLPQHIVFGKVVNKSIDSCLKTFDDTFRILQLALHVDQFSVASTARDFVRDIKSDVVSLNDAIDQLSLDVASLSLVAKEGLQLQEALSMETTRRELVAWIPNFDPRQLYQVLAEKAFPGTGSWFLDQHFKQWVKQKKELPRILWLQGKSGTGKTTLVTSAIEHLSSKQTSTAVAYFFCSVSLSDTRTLHNVLGSYLVQLCDQKPELWQTVMAWRDDLAHQQKGMLRRPGLDETIDMLQKICHSFEDIVFVLDAPNESETPKRMLDSLGHLIQQIPNLRMFISSTPDLVAGLPKHNDVSVVQMNLIGVNDDIRECVEARMEVEEQLHDIPRYLKDRILVKLLDRADGSFRWAECQLSAIIDNATSEAGINESLENLSASLEELYTETLGAISDHQAKPLRTALLWLAFAIRPLHIHELQEAMILREDTNEINHLERFLPGKAEALLAKCRMLINYDASNKKVSLAHSSVRDYLLSNSCRISRARLYHLKYDASLCYLIHLTVGYLNAQALSSGYTSTQEAYTERLTTSPLLVYSADSWPIFSRHIDWSNSSIQSRTENVLKSFFDSYTEPRGGNFGAWIQVYDPLHLYFTLKVPEGQALSTPLYYAARSGWIEVANMIIRVYGKLHLENPCGSRASTPLHVAAAYGRSSVVKLLLQHGADPNESNKYGERGAAWAEHYEYWEIVQMYLDHGGLPLTDLDRARIPKPNSPT